MRLGRLKMETAKKSIREIKEEFGRAGREGIPFLIERYSDDKRAGVSGLVRRYKKQLEDWEKELARIEGMLDYEREYAGYELICGVDEAGRGPLAGPVAAGAVILPKNTGIPYLDDSKKLSAKRREELYDEIMDKAVSAGVGFVGPARIDEINILQATYEAMREAIGKLGVTPDLLLNDAVTIPDLPMRQVPIIKGDAKSMSIAAASVIAKVSRDRLMAEYDRLMPEYGFAKNKGYGSKEHISALQRYGPSPIHRKTFIGNFI